MKTFFFGLLFSSTVLWAETLTVYTNRADLLDKGEFGRWTAGFNQQYPSINVNVIALERYSQEMLVRISRDDYGDVLLIPQGMPKIAWANYFSDLNTIVDQEKVYFSTRWSNGQSIYALPIGVNVEGLIYNKTVFNKAGLTPPKTLSELFRIAAHLKQQGITPIALNIGAAWPLQQWDKAVLMLARDGNYFQTLADDDSPFSVNKPYGKSLAIAKRLYAQGYGEKSIVKSDWQQSKMAFSRSEIAMMFMGSWAIPQLVDAGMDIENLGFVPFPVDENQQKVGLVNVDWGFAVSKKSKQQKAATAWLRYLLEESDYADVSGLLSSMLTRQPGIQPLKEFVQAEATILQAAIYDEAYLRRAHKAGFAFLQGTSVRNIIVNPDLNLSLAYWNEKWLRAKNTRYNELEISASLSYSGVDK